MPGRGEPIRLALEEAGADYDDVVRTKGVKVLRDLIGGDKHLAPPILRHGDLEISQLPNIMLYLGPKLKLVPSDELGKFRVNQLFLTAMECVRLVPSLPFNGVLLIVMVITSACRTRRTIRITLSQVCFAHYT